MKTLTMSEGATAMMPCHENVFLPSPSLDVNSRAFLVRARRTRARAVVLCIGGDGGGDVIIRGREARCMNA